jgi:hypothetical protein
MALLQERLGRVFQSGHTLRVGPFNADGAMSRWCIESILTRTFQLKKSVILARLLLIFITQLVPYLNFSILTT